MKLAVLVVLLAACQSAADDFPPGGNGGGGAGGNGGGGGGGATDASVADGVDSDAGPMITGRVCLLTDLRQIGVAAECADTGAGHWTVSLGSHTAISGDNGAFSIEAPLGGGFTWHVTAGRIVTSAMPFGADNTIPVLLADRYTELLTENQASLSDLQGSIVVRVVRSNQPVPDVVATALSDATMDSLYDANSAEIWGPNSTGTRGLAWLPSVTVPTPARQVPVTLSLLGTVVATTPVTVENQTVTFVTQELPPLP